MSSTVSEARDLHRWACSERSGSSGTSNNASANVVWEAFSGGAKKGEQFLRGLPPGKLPFVGEYGG